MIFRQLTHDDLGCASYLIGDERAGVAAVVDPKLEIEEYLALVSYTEVLIGHVLETHTHADHVSGAGRLAAATGARLHIHAAAEVDYEHAPFEDGWELELGAVRVRALHTPGHRPEHTAFALIDTARAPEPWAVLTGDSLFVGDVARADLAVEPEEGARGIFRSLHQTLLRLPAECEVWPGHLGGSLCGGPGMDMKVSSTIGFERAHSELLAIGDEDAFVARANAALGPQPPNFRGVVEANRAAATAEIADSPALTPRQVAAAGEDGALLVDVRGDREFDEAHIPGALCNPATRAGFGTKLAWVADRERPLVLIGDGDEDALRAGRLAAAVGLTNLAGHLAGGMASWRDEGRETERIERVAAADLGDGSGLQVLDVRERDEWEEGHIPGSHHLPYHDVDGIPSGLDPTRPIAVICSSGQRSAVAASLLRHQGAARVIHVADGGVAGWARAGGSLESG